MAERYDRQYTYNKKRTSADIKKSASKKRPTSTNRQTQRENYNRPQRSVTQKKTAKDVNIRKRPISDKRNSDIIRNNKFIGVDDSYLRTHPEAMYNDGFESFEREFKPQKRRPTLTSRQRKVRKVSLLTIFVLIVATVGVILSLTVFFETEKITVAPIENSKYTSTAIIRASELTVGKNLFLSDKKSAEKKIVNAFPYIESVKIKIKLPDTLEIAVTQATPSYYFEKGKSYAVVGGNNRILEINKSKTYKIPLIKGIEITGSEIGEYVSFNDNSVKKILNNIIATAEKNNLKNINEIDVSKLSSIKMIYDNRITINLGTNEDIDYKIRTALTIINDKLVKSDKGTLDVSLCNEGKRQSSFLPENMANADNQTVIIEATDTESSDTDTEQEDLDYGDDYSYSEDNYDDGYDYSYSEDNYDTYDYYGDGE